MDTKDLTAVLLKTIGLVMLAHAVFDLPFYFPPYVSDPADFSFVAAFMQAAATLTLPIILGLVLWFFPAMVTNRIVSGEKLSGSRFGVREFERVALTIVGAWLVAYGVTDLIHNVATLVLVRQQFEGAPPPTFRMWPGIIAAGAKVALGMGLAIGAKGISAVIGRVRGEG